MGIHPASGNLEMDKIGIIIMNEKYGTVSLVSLLGIAFIVLKLCEVIAWSWWWVLAPFLVLAAATMVSIFLIVLITLLVGVIVNPWAR